VTAVIEGGSVGVRVVLPAALVFAAYFGGAELGQWLSAEPGHFATFWPNSGLYLSCLLRTPPGRWWVIAAAAVGANLTSDVAVHGQWLSTALGFALANTVEAVVGAALVRYLFGASARLDDLRRVLTLFAITALVSTPIGGLIGAATVSAAYAAPFPLTWKVWWVADALGVLITAPLVLGVCDLKAWPRGARVLEGAALLGGLVVGGLVVFTATPPVAPILLFLFLLWAAIRLDVPGVAAAVFALAVVAVRSTVLGYGLYVGTGDVLQRIVSVQLFVAVPALVFYSFAVVLAERRRAEAGLEQKVRERTAAVRTSEERFRTLFESMDEGYCVADIEFDPAGRPIDYRVVEMNPAFERHTGLRGVLGRSIREAVPDLEEFWFETYGRVAVTGVPTRFEHPARPLGERWFDVYAFRLGGPGSTKVAILFNDITARKRAEGVLKESEAYFRSMVDGSPSMLWVTGPTGQCTYISRRWCEYTGTAMERNLGLGWLDRVHPDDRPRAGEVFLTANREGRPFTLDYRVRRHDGEYRWAVDAGQPRFDEHGRFVEYVGTFTDIHDRVQAEAGLREADRRKDEFLATLAHELRNPLAPLRNGLQIMKLAGGDPRAVENARGMMERQVEQMAHLISDLMDLSRISRGKIVLQKARMPIAVAVRNAVDTSRPLVEQMGHELTLRLPDDPVYVDADDTRLTQIFANLLNNAAKYTERGGRIRLSVDRQGGEVVVCVADTGVGIPAHFLDRVFDMFAQVDRSLERAQGGLGIGLNIVKRLVEMHGGGVEAHSDGPGKGSTFLVRLPAAAAPAGGESGGGSRAAAPRRRILVVDDNRDGAVSLAEMLHLIGHDTRTAHDGLEAVAVAEAFRPDVILMDIGMPKLNGYDACRRIRDKKWGRGVILIAQTGWGQDEDKRKSHDAGFDFHVTKPVNPVELERILAGLSAVTA
jgi:PAS domain S-box-containing protein